MRDLLEYLALLLVFCAGIGAAACTLGVFVGLTIRVARWAAR